MAAAPVATGGGRFVILVGPDGVGKTTVARAIIDQHEGSAAYFHFLPPVWGPMSATPEPNPPPPPPKARAGGFRVLGWIRLLRNAIKCWMGYFNTIRPALKRNCLVVGDRWMYGYLVQPDALRFCGPERLARAVVRLLPRPDLIVNLSAPSQLIGMRKQELTASQIEQELLAWSSLRMPNMQTLDASRSPQAIAREILGSVSNCDRVRNCHGHGTHATR
jgi:thymidylate kinase